MLLPYAIPIFIELLGTGINVNGGRTCKSRCRVDDARDIFLRDAPEWGGTSCTSSRTRTGTAWAAGHTPAHDKTLVSVTVKSTSFSSRTSAHVAGSGSPSTDFRSGSGI
jgi:hypothetical protein